MAGPCEQVIPAERAAAVLLGEQAEAVAIERRFHPSTPFGPVLGQGRVIGGCPPQDERVPDDGGPGELGEVGAGLLVAEHPPVVPELVELAEVPVDDPAPRLVRMAALGPLEGEPSYVVVQGGEHLGRDHAAVVGGPAPRDGIEPGDDRLRVSAASRSFSRLTAEGLGVVSVLPLG